LITPAGDRLPLLVPVAPNYTRKKSMKNSDVQINKMVVLHNSRVVDGNLYDTAFTLAKDAIDYLLTCDHLDGSEEFTTQMLCGDDQWSEWTRAQKLDVGRCLFSMAKKGILPLEPVGCEDKHKTPMRYRLKK
jgi:hypothetical protein